MDLRTTPWLLSVVTLSCMACSTNGSVAQQASLGASVVLPVGATTVPQMQEPERVVQGRAPAVPAKAKIETPTVGELLDGNAVMPGSFVNFLYFPKGRRPNTLSPMVGGC